MAASMKALLKPKHGIESMACLNLRAKFGFMQESL
jgi:hypothetical protein